MKRYIRSTSLASRQVAIEKTVRKMLQVLYHFMITSDDGTYASDNCEIVDNFLTAYESNPKLTFPQYVYEHRFDIFEDKFLKDKLPLYRDDRKWNEQDVEHAIDYFNSLTSADYNKILSLNMAWNVIRNRYL